MKIFFICGIDTDVGKTYVTSQLLYQALAHGHTVASYKPVQTGTEIPYQSEDLITHHKQVSALLKQSNQEHLLANYFWNDSICSKSYKAATSPHLAAIMEKEPFASIEFLTQELQQIVKQEHPRIKFAQLPEYFFVETAGGLHSPISPLSTNLDLLFAYQQAVAELVKQGHDLELKVVLITTGRLGAISATLGCLSLLPQVDYLVFNAMHVKYQELPESNINVQINKDSQYFYQQVITLANSLPAVNNLTKTAENFVLNSSLFQPCLTKDLDSYYQQDYQAQADKLHSLKNYLGNVQNTCYIVVE